MSEQLLEQVRDAVEGQIVCSSVIRLRQTLMSSLGFRGTAACRVAHNRLARRGRRMLPLPFLSVLTLTSLDNRFPRWFRHTRHQAGALYRPRWHRPHLRRRRSAVAILQQGPRGLVAASQRLVRYYDRCGRAESGLVTTCRGRRQT
jgi:hypothetical protein